MIAPARQFVGIQMFTCLRSTGGVPEHHCCSCTGPIAHAAYGSHCCPSSPASARSSAWTCPHTHGVLALAPAGLWRKHSPPITDAILAVNWRLGQILGERVATRPLRTSVGRRMSLRQISANPADVPADVATEMVKTVLASKYFPEHFKQTRLLRFTGGQQISSDVPIRIVWGNKDEIARARTSQHTDQLPAHATVETWPDCGHMLMWDAPERVVEAALAVPATGRGSAA
jgi:pimeloyl-ACP methyl ester carboxylesterase